MSTAPVSQAGTPVPLGIVFSAGVGGAHLIGQIVVIVATLLVTRSLCLRLRAEIDE